MGGDETAVDEDGEQAQDDDEDGEPAEHAQAHAEAGPLDDGEAIRLRGGGVGLGVAEVILQDGEGGIERACAG